MESWTDEETIETLIELVEMGRVVAVPGGKDDPLFVHRNDATPAELAKAMTLKQVKQWFADRKRGDT